MFRGRLLRSRLRSARAPKRSSMMRTMLTRRPFGRMPVRKAPVAVSAASRGAYGVKLGRGSTRVTQREHICTLVWAANATGDRFGTQVNFPTNNYVNPVNSNLFTWASQIAKAFEFYKFERLALVYEPVCNTNVGGTVAFAFENDPLDGPPSSFSAMSQYKGCVHGAPWAPHRMEVAFGDINRRRLYYTSVTSTDRRESDTGRFVVAGSSITNANTAPTTDTPLGQVYVEYTLRLWSPEVPSTSLGAVLPPNNDGLYGEILTSDASTGENFFDAGATITNSGDGATVIDNTGVFLADCEVLIVVNHTGTALGSFNHTASTATITQISSTISAAGTSSVLVLLVKAVSGQTLSITGAGTTVTARTMRIAAYNYDLA